MLGAFLVIVLLGRQQLKDDVGDLVFFADKVEETRGHGVLGLLHSACLDLNLILRLSDGGGGSGMSEVGGWG